MSQPRVPGGPIGIFLTVLMAGVCVWQSVVSMFRENAGSAILIILLLGGGLVAAAYSNAMGKKADDERKL